MKVPPFPRIAIIGGGPCGLTLARILQVHGIEATVYERESTRHARSQGGSLDLHVESGQRALREAGLEKEFLKIAHPEGQAVRVMDKHGHVLFDAPAKPGVMARPEADRTALRGMLLDSVRPENVRWGHQLTHLAPLANGRYRLRFMNGETAEADLVVGADGGRSRVRPVLSDAKPIYTGLTFIDTSIANGKLTRLEIAQAIGTGGLFALGDGKGIFARVLGNGSINGYVGLLVPEDWIAAFDEAAEVRAALLSHFADWSSVLVDLIRHCDEPLLPIAINMLPFDHRWEHKPGVTLIGDAAHLMSPFAGEGVNLAMLDAMELALALAQTTDFNAAVRHCEAAMFERAAQASAMSIANQKQCFSPDGARLHAELMARHHCA